MRILKGIPISSGIVMGKPSFIKPKKFSKSEEKINSKDIENHIQQFDNSIAKSIDELNVLLKMIEEEAHKNILLSHKEILKDNVFNDQIRKFIEEELYSVDYAIHKHFDDFVKHISNVDDEFISQRKEDFKDVKNTLMSNLRNYETRNTESIEENTVIATNIISPSLAFNLLQKNILGLIAENGTSNSHSGIIAKSMRIPVVFGLKNAVSLIKPDDLIILNGSKGYMIINPDQEQIKNYESEKKKEAKIFEKKYLLQLCLL